uniref:Capsid protein n=1 Tax=virus sp. ctL6D46 TaxID=2827989 RepID=A0A8S5S3Y1_9VIRU|nr:MAG TPA: Capsid protein [virus sp. ctL6D46]
MPVYSYRYRRRYGRRYSRYRRYGAYSRYRRRRSGTSSTASSRGRIRVRVPVQQIVTLTIPANSTDSNVLTSTPYYHGPSQAPLLVCGATASPLYRAYAALYDQVKCDGVVTSVSVVTPIGAASGAAAQALQVVLAYDRTGTYAEASNGGQQLSVSKLFNFSSSVSRSAINNSVAKMARSCWASDIQERTQFHDAAVGVAGGEYYDYDWNSNAQKVGYFSPLTLVGLRSPALAPTAGISVTVLIEQSYYFTFRNPKFGGDPSATASLSTKTIDAPVAAQAAAATMDDDGGLDDEDAAVSAPVRSAPRRTPLSELWNDARSVPLPQ